MWNSDIRHNLKKLQKLQARPEWIEYGRNSLRAHQALHPIVREAGLAAPGWRLILSPVAASLAVVVLVVVGATSAAAQQALPTDFLYPIKLASEKARLALTVTKSARVNVRLQHADERLNEASVLSQRRGPAQVVAETLARYEGEVRGVAELAAVATERGDTTDLPLLVRFKLVQQQRQLERLHDRTPDDAEEDEAKTSRPQAEQVAVLQAIKTSSEGELRVIIEPQNVRLESKMGKRRTSQTKLESQESLPVPQAQFEVSDSNQISAGAAAATPLAPIVENIGEPDNSSDDEGAAQLLAEVEDKISATEAKLASLEVEAAIQGSERLARLVDKAKEGAAEAREILFDAAADNSPSQLRNAHRRALKAYQLTLEAEIINIQPVLMRDHEDD